MALETSGVNAAKTRRVAIPGQRSWQDRPPLRDRLPGRRLTLARPELEPSMLLATDVMALAIVVLTAGSASAVAGAVAASLTWRIGGLYTRRIALSLLDDLPLLGLGAVVALASATVASLVRPEDAHVSTIVVAAAILAAVVPARGLVYAVILRQRSRRRISYPTLMVGAGAPAQALAARISAHPETGLEVVGTLGGPVSREQGLRRREQGLRSLGTTQDLARVVSERGITDVVIGYGGMSSAQLVDVLCTCDRVNVDIHVVPRLFELHTLRGGDDHIWGIPLVRIRTAAQRAQSWRLKRAFDVTVAMLVLLAVSPVMALVAAAVRLRLGKGVLFRQTRIGMHGRAFELLKFRSMRPAVNARDDGWVAAADRVGPFGKFIRDYSLDELPQLVNVVRGDMSLVGPRPERPEYVEQFSSTVPRYGHRHRAPVGLTGLAAVNGLRGDTSIEDRAHFDNWYIDNWSLWLDVKIVLRTLSAVLRGAGR